MKTGKQILEDLFDDQRAAAHDPHHPVNDQLRASLLWKKHLLELIQIPRHQLKSDDSYVLVSDIPEYFKAQFEQFFLGQNLLQHVHEHVHIRPLPCLQTPPMTTRPPSPSVPWSNPLQPQS